MVMAAAAMEQRPPMGQAPHCFLLTMLARGKAAMVAEVGRGTRPMRAEPTSCRTKAPAKQYRFQRLLQLWGE